MINTRDYTYKVLHKLASDTNLVVLSGDKDSSVVIMQREVYVNKLEEMIKEGIKSGKYPETEDSTLHDLKSFQNFLTRNFKTTLPLKDSKPTSNQPAFLYDDEITNENLKLRPIVSTCGTYYYETAKFLASYLMPLTDNEYSLKNTSDFADHLKNSDLAENEIPISYVTSLLSEVPLDYIIDRIYTENKLPQLSSKLLFRLLSKYYVHSRKATQPLFRHCL